MPGWSPPSVPRTALVTAAVLYAVVLVYLVLIRGTILLGLFPGLVAVVLYVVWRFLVALEAIADGVHRIADEHEREG